MREARNLSFGATTGGMVATEPATLQSRLERSPEALATLWGDLTQAWETAEGAGLFQHPAWLQDWLATFGGERLQPLVWLGLGGRGGLQAYSAWSIESRAALGRTFRRVQPLGSSVWTRDAFPSEHPAIVDVVDGRVRASTRAALDALLAADWDDLVVPYVCVGGELDRALAAWADGHRLPWVRFALPSSYAVDTRGRFDLYRGALSANTRRAAFTKRRSAEAQKLEYVQASVSVDAGLRALFELHDARWAAQGMPARGRAFMARVAARSTPGLRFRVSLLQRDGHPVSARLCAIAKRRVYDLQAGFRPSAGAGLSLGKLHLGHDIEACFQDAGIDFFDLLAGPGMREEYKAPFATHGAEVYTFRAARSAVARAILAARRWFPRQAPSP